MNTIPVKFTDRILYAEIALLIVIFQLLPNRFGGCLGHAGVGYGWPMTWLIRFAGDGASVAEWANPSGYTEIQYLSLIIDVLVIAALALLIVLAARRMRNGFLAWTRGQLLMQVSVHALLAFINVYFAVWHHRDLASARGATSFFFEGWPVPSSWISVTSYGQRYLSGWPTVAGCLNFALAAIIPISLVALSRCLARRRQSKVSEWTSDRQ